MTKSTDRDRFKVIITTYNREPLLLPLLDDLRRERAEGADLTVVIYDDLSRPRQADAQHICEAEHWHWIRAKKHHGKKLYWQWFNQILDDCRSDPAGLLYVMLPDDIRLCKRFLHRASEIWKGIRDPRKRSLNLFIDQSRIDKPCWTGFAPVRKSPAVTLTQWVDGLFLSERSLLEDLHYKIQAQDPQRWATNPLLSSGVGADMSKRLAAMGRSLYRVNRSLAVHVCGPSQMNPRVRRVDSMETVAFIDGDRRCQELQTVAVRAARRGRRNERRDAGRRRRQSPAPVTSRPRQRPNIMVPGGICSRVEASLATIPSRAKNLPQVVSSLIEQVDVLRVYLNGYRRVPACLNHPRIEHVRSQDHGDNGDAGKLWWSDKCQGYQLTCDDDLIYPRDYVKRMVGHLNSLDRQAALSLHGVIVDESMISFYRIPRKHHWRVADSTMRSVNVLGTGALIYHADLVKITPADLELPNMADIWFALYCQRHRIPCATCPRPASWLKLLPTSSTIYDQARSKDQVHTKIVKRIWPWEVFPLPGRQHSAMERACVSV